MKRTYAPKTRRPKATRADEAHTRPEAGLPNDPHEQEANTTDNFIPMSGDSDVFRMKPHESETVMMTPQSETVMMKPPENDTVMMKPNSDPIQMVEEEGVNDASVVSRMKGGGAEFTESSGRQPKKEALPPHARGTFDPQTRIYTVAESEGEEGFDTLYGIAKRFGIAVDYLKGVNDLTGDTIHPGHQLRIPNEGVDFESTFTTEKELREVVVEGEKENMAVTDVFGNLNNTQVNNFVYKDSDGVKATRLTTEGRKSIQTAINAAGVSSIGSLVAAATQLYFGKADKSTGTGALASASDIFSETLKNTDELTDLFSTTIGFVNKGLLVSNQAGITFDAPKVEERLTELLFIDLKTNLKNFGYTVPGKELEQFVFYKKYSEKGAHFIANALNEAIARLQSILTERGIDINTEEGFNYVEQAIINRNSKQ
ncbi:MAG: LysM peptidoglycan-binding domain-containing protein [Bacteroidota bacterium]